MSDLYIHKILNWPRVWGQYPNKPYWRSITAAERHAAQTHCGPHESYPLGPGCAHVSAAFTLAMSGHGSPSMSCIKSYARSHGCSVPPSQKAIGWGSVEWRLLDRSIT